MTQSPYWQKQSPDKPLFPDMLWSRPENRANAGKLLIIGGNLHGFAAPAEAYQTSLRAGIGISRVILPDALKKMIGRAFEAGEYAPSTPSGSFSRQALNDLLEASEWADGVLVAGDLGRNSETAILLEGFARKYIGPLILTKDAADYFTSSPRDAVDRDNTVFVVSFAQLQKLATAVKFSQAFTFNMDLLRFVESLHDFTSTFHTNIIVKHLDTIFVASRGSVTTTKLLEDHDIWRVNAAAYGAVWWLQNPTRQLAALSCAVYEFTKH